MENKNNSNLTYLFNVNNNDLNKKQYRHKNNKISTTKYNIITFLPKALLFQFLRLANIYFLIIAIIQCIGVISPLSPSTAIAPLAFVLFVSVVREGYEDLMRYSFDKSLNLEKVTVFKNNKWHYDISQNLQVGEIVLVKEDESFPADLIIIDSNLSEGLCFIETGTLDGEKAPKLKIANKEVAGYFNIKEEYKQNIIIYGNVNTIQPNQNLYELDGNMHLKFKDENENDIEKIIPLTPKQLLLKGAILRSTKWIIGIVVYSGHNTKLIKNSGASRVKFSRVETLMSKLLVAILFLQMCLCIITAGLNSYYFNTYVINNNYLPRPSISPFIDSLISYFTYLLLLNTMIPISLIITMEIAKIVQGGFMRIDAEMFSHVRMQYAKAGSISLNEELGQINFIFSDKTGTLTCNKMVLKYNVIGDVCYQYESEFNKIEKTSNTEIEIYGDNYMCKFLNKVSITTDKTKFSNFIINSENKNVQLNLENEANIIEEYWKALSINHECQIKIKDGKEIFTGDSPDEIELVRAASKQGFANKVSDKQSIRRLLLGDDLKDFEILQQFSFDSDRKRSSIIIRDKGFIKLYIKGADTIIAQKLSKVGQNKDIITQTKEYVNEFSSQGYRCLYIGMKIFDEQEYLKYANLYDEAKIKNNKDEINSAISNFENNIILLGATIVEDKLQDGVPETIRDLRLAGIKIWMITGDKIGTAYNIALSCNLISKDLENFKIEGESGYFLENLISDFDKFKNSNKNKPNLPQYSFLIDAIALQLIINVEKICQKKCSKCDINCNETICKHKRVCQKKCKLICENNKKIFAEIAFNASAVVCSRVNASEKADVVKLIKQYDTKTTTLAIGDGNNDVKMINEAHIGIGVYGDEGLRAVQCSDFAIGEFKILRRLLLFHGRTNNIRICNMILYFFYKNFVFTITHFYFAFYNNFSGQTIIDDWFITLYNLIFTAFPLGARAVLDHDVIPDDGKIIYKMMPFLFMENRDKPLFTVPTFILSLLRGIVHGIINFFFIFFIVYDNSVDSDGNTVDLWYVSANLYTGIIFIVSFRLLILQKYHTWMNAVVMLIFSWLLYIIFLANVQINTMFNSVGTIQTVFNSGKFWLNFVLILGTCSLIDLFTYAINTLFSNNISGTLMILVKERKTINSNVDLPEKIEVLLKQYDIYSLDSKINEKIVERDDKGNIIIYKSNNKESSIREEVALNDPKYFENKKLTQTNPYVANLIVDELTPKNIKIGSSKPV